MNEKETQDRDALAFYVNDLPAGQYWKFRYLLKYESYPSDIKTYNDYLGLLFFYYFKDGYTQLSVDHYPQPLLTINLANGPQNVTFAPPRFKDGVADDSNYDIEL